MSTPHFFGYGSLVNTATHDYPDARPATLLGWRRAWVRTDLRDVVFLTAVPDAEASIQGLIAAVPNADWAALDLRETGYGRVDATRNIVAVDPPSETALYQVHPKDQRQDGQHHILMSYLDVVVQGYFRVFGMAGVAEFFATTDGWDTPVLNDRANPRYPRAQILTSEETEAVDLHLAGLRTPIVTA